jgi:hypothetical protein
MNCLPNIAISLLLISLTAGMWLLYKTQKENLNTFFKVVSWFVIVASFLTMICCGMRCMFCSYSAKYECGGMQQCGMNMSRCGMRSAMCMAPCCHKMMFCKGEDDECEMMGKGCCKEGKEECEKECCKKSAGKCGMKMEMKKDSVSGK